MRLRIAILAIGPSAVARNPPSIALANFASGCLCRRFGRAWLGTDPSDRRHVGLSVASWRFGGGAEISAAGRALQDLLTHLDKRSRDPGLNIEFKKNIPRIR